MYYELQPLRIKAGWKVEYNNFSEYDIDEHGESDIHELNEDLLRLYNEKENLIIDLGWYPAYDANGNYILELFKNNEMGSPLERIISKSKTKIVNDIEKWVCYGFLEKYL